MNEQAPTNLERAKQKEQRWQQLQRAGVVSQVEVERAARQAAEAALRLEQARVVHWKEQVEQQRARLAKGETSREMLDTAERSLRSAEQLAAEAEAFFKKHRLEIAQANLERQQRLLALGAGSKAQVEQAAAAVADLQAGAK